ncbi:hypothetical protein BsWGS_08110 [Bradybaena similaris]
MSLWSPTHVQFTVLRARNLVAKGKGGNNDVFVTIQLGKEKYQTSTIKSALNPEWFEECDLPITDMRSEVQVSLFHRGVLSDDFLGYAAIPLWEHKITESSTSSWLALKHKPSKPPDNKYRGELEVKLTFHCRSRTDLTSRGLKKRSSSIRNLASAFGDKFKLSRSRSYRDIRENRRDSDVFKMDKSRTMDGQEIRSPQGAQEGHPRLCAYPYNHQLSNSPVHFSALDISRAPWGMDPNTPDALTRSYSMSAAYIKSMSLDRSKLANYPGSRVSNSSVNKTTNTSNGSIGNISFNQGSTMPGVSQLHSQSLYNLPGNRRSCAEVPFHQPPPPPYDLKSSSKDDSVLSSRHRRAASEHQLTSVFRVPVLPIPNNIEPPRRDRSGIYESIKERTEPENSASSSDPESVPMPKPRMKRFGQMESSSRSYLREYSLPLSSSRPNSSDQHPFNGRDSGILDDRSPSLGNSLEGSITTTDGAGNGSKAQGQTAAADCNIEPSKRDFALSSTADDRGITQFLDKETSMNGSSKIRKKVTVPSQFYSKENAQGELVVRKRSRGQRDRLRQLRQANRRYTVQGLEHGASGLYDESVSEPSDSSRTEVSDDLVSVFKNMTKEELLRVVLTSKAQMIRKDQYIRDLENYIDDLLVRVMETTPRLLSRHPLHRL